MAAYGGNKTFKKKGEALFFLITFMWKNIQDS